MPKVAIGIQARMTSERLPGKSMLKLEGVPMIDRIWNTCVESAMFLNRQNPKSRDGNAYDKYEVSVHLLLPAKDELVSIYKVIRSIFEHHEENDCLSRYIRMANQTEADYIVRVTGDCVHIPTHMISRAIKNAVIKDADYVSNVVHRTSCEGFDVEVLSRAMLDYVDQLAGPDPMAREHVTLALVQDIHDRPEFYKENFNIWHLFEHYDFSGIKTSVDTQKDYEIAKRNFASVERKKREASKSGYVSK